MHAFGPTLSDRSRAAYPLGDRHSFPEPQAPTPRTVQAGELVSLLPDSQAVRLPKDDAFGHITMGLPGQSRARLPPSDGAGVSITPLADGSDAENDGDWESLTGGSDAADGPLLELRPHGSRFAKDSPVKVSFDATSLLQEPQYADGEEEGVLLILKQAGPSEPWLPLQAEETLTITADGIATVRLHSFSRIRPKYFPGASSVARAAKAAANAVEKAAGDMVRKGVQKVAEANPTVVNSIVKYGAIAAGAALSAATVATGGVVGLAMPVVAGKLQNIVANPQCVQSFAQTLQAQLEDQI